MPQGFDVGDHVWADFGGGQVLAHVVSGAHDVNGETKYAIQSPEGDKVNMAYREPADRDAGGSGLTFWTVK